MGNLLVINCFTLLESTYKQKHLNYQDVYKKLEKHKKQNISELLNTNLIL